MIKISRFSKNGLTKTVYGFEYENDNLQYVSQMMVNRSTTKEKWVDELPHPMNYEEWCTINKMVDSWESPYDNYSEYQKYRHSQNPVLQKTTQGKVKLSGITADIEDLPSCPKDVADEALKKFRAQIKVVYRV